MDWKLYYDDVPTFSDVDGFWKNAPQHGVICCVVRDETGAWGRFVNSGYAPHKLQEGTNEFYIKYPDSNQPIATRNLAPFYDRMAAKFPKVDPEQQIKYGRQTDQIHWQDIMNLAANDTDFPTAVSPRRRKTDFPAE